MYSPLWVGSSSAGYILQSASTQYSPLWVGSSSTGYVLQAASTQYSPLWVGSGSAGYVLQAASSWLLLSTWLNSWQLTNQPTSYDLLLILIFSVVPLCAHSHLVRDLFLVLHHLSGTLSLAKLYHQTHSHLSHPLWNLTSSNYPTDCMCVHARVCLCTCMCVGGCMWVGAHTLMEVCFDYGLFFVMGHMLQFWQIAHKRVHHCYYVTVD